MCLTPSKNASPSPHSFSTVYKVSRAPLPLCMTEDLSCLWHLAASQMFVISFAFERWTKAKHLAASQTHAWLNMWVVGWPPNATGIWRPAKCSWSHLHLKGRQRVWGRVLLFKFYHDAAAERMKKQWKISSKICLNQVRALLWHLQYYFLPA